VFRIGEGSMGLRDAKFNRTFWTAILFELFERGGWYAVLSVLGVYWSLEVGLSDDQIGTLLALNYAVLFLVPIIAPIAEKLGYRVALAIAFSMMIAGHSTLLVANSFPTIAIGLLSVALGGAFFKPVISANVARASSESQRDMAYRIYYASINVGATLFPFLFGVYLKMTGASNGTVFLLPVILFLTSFGILALFFRPPPAPQGRTVRQALNNLLEVRKDPLFLLLLVLYSGFYFVYAMTAGFLPIYFVQYVASPIWFTIAFLAVVNPLTIVLSGVPVS
jgi:dipeptide/tripeptide permease